MLNIAEPTPPLPRSTISSAKDLENPASTLLTATTAMPAAITPGSPKRSTRRPAGSAPTTRISANTLITLAAAVYADAKLAGEGRDGRGDDPEPECDRERYRGEDRHFRRQILERAPPGTKHETALCQLTGS